MKIPNTPEQLAAAIESLVASYMDEVRVAAQQAVERSLCRSKAASALPKRGSVRRAPSRPATKRRTAAEMADLCEALCQAVRARPGESMASLAEEMEVPASTLVRPMAQLRTDERVRSLGERHLTRYYPAVVAAAARGT